MKTSELNKSARKVQKALMEPINMLTKDLRKKLQGVYGECEVGGWRRLQDIHRVSLNYEFPGHCYIRSKINEKRYIFITIHFNWNKWDKTMQSEHPTRNLLEFNVYDDDKYPRNHFENITFEKLDNPSFIEDIKKWLNGEEISWKKWNDKK